MELAELVEKALARVGDRRVELTTLEPAEVSADTAGALIQIVGELVDNAETFSSPDDKVRITGLFDRDAYLISISDQGVGISEDLISALNRLLEDPRGHSGAPEATLGIPLVARLAARLGVSVQLIPGVPGTTARVTIPPGLVTRSGPFQTSTVPAQPAPEASAIEVSDQSTPAEEPPPFSGPDFTSPIAGGTEHVVAMSDAARREAESFLDRVFGPLVGSPSGSHRPAGRATSTGASRESRDEPRPTSGVARGAATTLRVRVPGENFSLTEDDPSTVAAERAIDIRSALTNYEQGRRKAATERQ